MLSYRHSYHAGNHADILKHYCLFEVLTYYLNRGKKFSYIDTHAGAGLYNINSDISNKTKEYESGVLKLMQAQLDMGSRLHTFKKFLVVFMQSNQYPGSPYIASSLMPKDYLLYLYELHPRDFSILQDNMSQKATMQKIKLLQSDGLQGLLAILPPTIKRAIVMLDPSYEVKIDYSKVVKTLCQAYRKFSTGCYLVWYPLLPKMDLSSFRQALLATSDKYIQVELLVADKYQNFGMYGSGMWIINPPYQLDKHLSIVLPELIDILKQHISATFVLKRGIL